MSFSNFFDGQREFSARYIQFLARDVILYISRLCYDVSVRLSVRLHVYDGIALAHYS